MAIDTSGEWWKGSEVADIEEYLASLEPGGYPVDRATPGRCACGSAVFAVEVDRDNELARTICAGCKKIAYVADAEEHWDDAEPETIDCPDGHAQHEVALGLCVRDGEDGEWVRWMSLGLRCATCGILSSPDDWKSDLALTDPACTRIG